MREIVLQYPISEVTVFYVEEYNAIILRQSVRNGHVDIVMTIAQLKELIKSLSKEEK